MITNYNVGKALGGKILMKTEQQGNICKRLTFYFN